MAGVILENISTKKLVCICLALFALQLTCFIVPGIKAPQPTHTQSVYSHICVDNRGDKNKWYYPFGAGNCTALQNFNDPLIQERGVTAEQVVFAVQYPLPRSNTKLKMSRWFMYHVAVLSFEILYNKDNLMKDNAAVNLEVRVAYRDSDTDEWKELIAGDVYRNLNCRKPDKLEDKYPYDCDIVDLFEIGHMHNQEYLVNIRMPPNAITGHNMDIGELSAVHLVWFAQTGGFTLFSLVTKTVCFAMVFPLMVWNWKRVADLNRPPVFLEKLLLGLAMATCILNFPVDWFVLTVKMPFMLLWSDIRQGFFLTILLTYWLVFTGEHMVDDVKRGEWTSYWKQLAVVILSSLLMFVFDLCERGMRLSNPFFSLWATETGTILGKTFIGIACAAGVVYFLVLLAFIVRAILNIWRKRSAFPGMAKGLRIHYMSVIYRFFFTLIFSLVCCVLTVSAFIMGQVYESQWKWQAYGYDPEEDVDEMDDDATSQYYHGVDFQTNTAFQLGVYCTWNVYVMAMLIFYAPSHKAPASVAVDDDETEERVELTTVSQGVRTRSMAATTDSQDITDETTTLTGTGIPDTGMSQIHSLAAKSAQD